MKIYTRSGDRGDTGLFGGARVSKAHPRVEAYGTLDELNAVLGVAAAACDDEVLADRIEAIQRRLFDLGADVATPPDTRASEWIVRATPEWAAELERAIDAMAADLPPLETFILPGGSAASASMHHARTVCRRAERRLAAAIDSGEAITPAVLVYVNRLSDWLFTAARWANLRSGREDVSWRPSGSEGA